MTESLAPLLIDVVIPVYNGAAYLRQALDSVTAQTCPPRSIIVIDDGSTDQTPHICQEYRGAVPLIYHRQENRGLSAARNAGWKKSDAPYIAFLDSDDVWEPGKLAAQVVLWQSSPLADLVLVYCGYSLIDTTGKTIHPAHLPIVQPKLRGRVFQDLLPKNTISGSGSGVIIRREALERVGGFDESLRALEDWDMWLRLAEIGSFDFVPEDLVAIRTHQAGMQHDSERMMNATLNFLNLWLTRLPKDHEVPRAWLQTLARYAGATWPPQQLLTLVRTHLSPAAQQRLRQHIQRHAKGYVSLRLLSLPAEWLIRQPWRNAQS